MPTRKIADPPKFNICGNPEHRPPTMYVFAPGTYEHTCPGCGNKIVFVVPPPPAWATAPTLKLNFDGYPDQSSYWRR